MESVVKLFVQSFAHSICAYGVPVPGVRTLQEQPKGSPCPRGAYIPLRETDHRQAYRATDDAAGGEKRHMGEIRWKKAQEGPEGRMPLAWGGGCRPPTLTSPTLLTPLASYTCVEHSPVRACSARFIHCSFLCLKSLSQDWKKGISALCRAVGICLWFRGQ